MLRAADHVEGLQRPQAAIPMSETTHSGFVPGERIGFHQNRKNISSEPSESSSRISRDLENVGKYNNFFILMSE